MNNREAIRVALHHQLKISHHLIGVAAGTGATAKYAQQGGADFILALSSGRFRQMGVSSLAGFMPYANSNELVLDFAYKEMIPIVRDIPIIFGFNATDPTIDMMQYLQQIKEKGFAGINNFPSVGLFDGQFREALEESGLSYEQEVKAIHMAHKLDLFTVAFVFNAEQAQQMAEAGADVICAHLGLTTGGALGARKIVSLQTAKQMAQDIFACCTGPNSHVIKMIYGGPVNKPIDVQFMYDGLNIDGYIGGSAFERIPAEQTVVEVTRSFKKTGDFDYDHLIEKIIAGIGGKRDYIDFVKQYVRLNYMNDMSLEDIASILKLSRPYVSQLFKKETGLSFTSYVIEFRIGRAIDLMRNDSLTLHQIADMVGYHNYEQFSKIFKRYKGVSPRTYREHT
ncbi:phosphoenolpyruvate hydrolase family protein [Lentibacillus saliphilus]|uniref:phosphoenolpyruvate hydrolase family protein n=1 Tax=Lentibacillus saliphilus TaxID=2737028 RepID=UPI001C2F5016|nr:phosphoenolpyruvate hydrolase family protein [Lentibacillus saliphilus]